MVLLLMGLLLFMLLHLLPATAPAARARLIAQLGLGAYKGLFALGIVAGLVLIVLGWQAMTPLALWNPPYGLRHLTILLMWPAAVLVVAGNLPANPIRSKLGHPMLMGVGTWALAHLLANGELRSLLLFGAFAIWSFVAIRAIKRRDGGKPPAVQTAHPLRAMAVVIIAGTVLWLALIWAHPWFTGRPVIAI